MLRVERSERHEPEEITIPDRLRAMNEDRVSEIMASFEKMGQVSPIQVRVTQGGEDVILIAGRHRLEAARRLGWQWIQINVVSGDEDDFRLWEIAENLHRSELTALERDEHIAEWIRLTDKKFQSAQLAPIEGSKRDDGRGHRKASGVNAASRELGVERTDAQRAAKVASISPEAKQAARDVGIDTNRSALLKVAAAPKDEQVEVAMALGAARTTRKKADDDDEAVAAFVSFIVDNLPETAIGELAERLEKGPVKKFVVALRGLA